MKKSLIEIGKIVKSKGLKGSMNVLSYFESQNLLESLDEVYVGQGIGDVALFKVKNIRFKHRSFSLDLEGIDSIEISDSLIGCYVYIPSDRLDKLPEDEYYWSDIIGLEVVTRSGKKLGYIESILATGSNDVYVCTGGEREILLPAIADVIKEIDIEKGIMVVELLKGL